jgi:CheY-like chemotaxis protein/HPt (histidine-containing phosphotransfer) domain-containing protein
MLELLKDTGLTAQQADYVQTAESSGDALLSVINDILDFSKMEAGRLELDEHDFDLRALVEETCEMLAVHAYGKGLELSLWIDDALPATVRGDGGRLRQVLTNLLSNAIKFTASGEVTVRVAMERRDSSELVAAFEVADTGIGIDPDRVDALFEPFSQADVSTTRRFGGTGLGLAIATQLVGMMRGELSAESLPGEGSTFRFTATLGTHVEAEVPRVAEPAIADGTRVLVVDDNAANREIVLGYLRAAGARCEDADSGPVALDRLRTAAGAGTPFQAVVLDCHMPGMDGIELAREIRAAPSLRGAHLLMLTSTSSDATAAREAGVARYMAKPVRRARLLSAVAELLAGTPVEPEPAAETPPVPDERAPVRGRVLVAEDNAVNQAVIVGMLAKRGFAADVVGDGAAAVGGLRPGEHAAVFMDCQMPVLDGYAATERIRAQETPGERVPIIAMTAHAMAGDRERCLAAGMDDYVAKPVRPEELDAVLERWLGDPGDGEPDVLVDAERIRSFVEDFPGMAEQLLALFADTTPPLVDELRAAAERGDADAVRRTLHQLKGSCQNMGAVAMAEVCVAAEAGTTTEPDAAEQLRALLSRTVHEATRIIAAAPAASS